jgi:hypothetical protein
MHYKKTDFPEKDPYKIFNGEKILDDCVEANDDEGWAVTQTVTKFWTTTHTTTKRHYGKIMIVRFEGYDEGK